VNSVSPARQFSSQFSRNPGAPPQTGQAQDANAHYLC
jgi:hypothetical protein